MGKLSRLAILLFFIAVLCAIIVLAANRFADNREVIIYAVATGLSMIPASLIVVLTITMAVGTKRMVERNVVVRKMNALEALGAITDICSDKTGTLTQGQMVTRKCWIPSGGTYTISQSNEPFNPTLGDISYIQSTPTSAQSDEKMAEGHVVDYQTLLQENEELKTFSWLHLSQT
ncbi:P-type ATPase [Taxawa tesnikishii (nom. ined.)]|nr:P-type ATPase [Dothideales sp. JES 119]